MRVHVGQINDPFGGNTAKVTHQKTLKLNTKFCNFTVLNHIRNNHQNYMKAVQQASQTKKHADKLTELKRS